eukprot:2025254-Prymnesium_polylepis.1
MPTQVRRGSHASGRRSGAAHTSRLPESASPRCASTPRRPATSISFSKTTRRWYQRATCIRTSCLLSKGAMIIVCDTGAVLRVLPARPQTGAP